MASPSHLSASPGSPRTPLEPIRFPESLLDGRWRPRSTDLGVELCSLVPVLDQVRGPVKRLLLGVTNWTARPNRITTDGRTVSIGYAAGQSPTMVNVFCADGGTFTVRVTPPGATPAAP
jgi:hypothetical protein